MVFVVVHLKMEVVDISILYILFEWRIRSTFSFGSSSGKLMLTCNQFDVWFVESGVGFFGCICGPYVIHM